MRKIQLVYKYNLFSPTSAKNELFLSNQTDICIWFYLLFGLDDKKKKIKKEKRPLYSEMLSGVNKKHFQVGLENYIPSNYS